MRQRLVTRRLRAGIRCGDRRTGARLNTTYNTSWLTGLDAAVGNTPLLRLNKISRETGCTVLGKAEFMNPGGSVKDRAALYLIRDAEERGLISEGGTIVEGTAGNTGIGLAHICRARGYDCKIFMPDTQSPEKMDLLRALGAEVFPVPVAPFEDPANYNHQAARYAAELENCYWTNQFDNVANRHGHFVTTGPEIWQQTDGTVDAFTSACGTGGTLAGVSNYLKQKRKDVRIVLADPPGSALYEWFHKGTLERKGSSITEGIGQGRVTDNLAGTAIDDAIHVPDEDTIATLFECLYYEGLFIGASSALNVEAARRVAQELGPGHTVVTMICDGAYRYQSRLFSRSWLESKGLLASLEDRYHAMLVE